MRGFVLDQETGAPIEHASITVEGINHTIYSATMTIAAKSINNNHMINFVFIL